MMKNNKEFISKRIVVTGGAGYIGRHLIKSLIDMNHEILVVDNFSNSSPIHSRNKLEVLETDIANTPILRHKFLEFKPNILIHLAALKSINASIDEMENYKNVNIKGTESVLAAIENIPIEGIVFSSTAAVYSPQNYQVHEESETNPINEYGKTKLEAEKKIQIFSEKFEIPVYIFRFFNVAGGSFETAVDLPIDNLCGIIYTAIKENSLVRIFGKNKNTVDGTCSRDYIHVQDIVDAHILAVNKILEKNLLDRINILNLGSQNATTVLEVIKHFELKFNTNIHTRILDPRPGEVGFSLASTNKATKELGFVPSRDIMDIVEDYFYLFLKESGSLSG